MLHDFKTGAKLASLAHDGAARSAALQFCASDADRLATASDDGGVAVWSVAARAARHELRRLHRVRRRALLDPMPRGAACCRAARSVTWDQASAGTSCLPP
jgi:hypothetical protein